MDLLQLGIQLKAFDMMSGVIESAANKAIGSLSSLEEKISSVSQGFESAGASMMATGAMLGGLMANPILAFAEAEDAAMGLKVSMMGAGGEVDKQFGAINSKAASLGAVLPGTAADYQNMMSTLVQQGVSYEAILGGVGEAAAYMGVLMKKPPEQAAEFAAKMQDATGTAEKDMMSLMDTIQRSTYMGVDSENMLSFYTKMAPAMDTMKQKGAGAAREMAPFAVMFDQMGMQGESAGNALRKAIQLGLDTKKVAKANAALATKGIKLDFTDGKGEFGGMANLMAQLDKLKELDTVSRLSAMKDIFGDDAETLQVLGKVIEKGADGYNEVVDKLAAQATLQQRVNAQLGTLKNLWGAAAGTFNTALAGFGEAMAPELKSAVDMFGELSKAMDAFIKSHPMLSKAVGVGTTALAGLLLAGGAVALTLGTITKLAGGLMKPFKMISGLFGKKGAAGAADAAAALAGSAVQRVFVVNWPLKMGGQGVGFGEPAAGAGGRAGAGARPVPGAATPARAGRMARLLSSARSMDVGKWAGRLGAAAVVANGAYNAYELMNDKSASRPQKVEQAAGIAGGVAGSLGGAMLGAKLGATIGTFIAPGLGTAIGGAIGGVAGGIAGSTFGTKIGEWGGKALNGIKGLWADAPVPAAAVLPAAAVVAGSLPKVTAASNVPSSAAMAGASALPVSAAPVAAAIRPESRAAGVLPADSVMAGARVAPVSVVPSYAAAAGVSTAAAVLPVNQPVPLAPLNPAVSSGKTAAPIVMTYNPQLTIQGDPLPGTTEKFSRMLREHQNEIQQMIDRAIQNKQRVSYGGA